jgi:transcriptional regulator with XRE-family HTH domain
MSRIELSRRSGVSERHIQFIEKGKTNPSSRVILKLSRVLNVDLEKISTEFLNQGERNNVINDVSNKTVELDYLTEHDRYKFRSFGIIDIGEVVQIPVEDSMYASGKPVEHALLPTPKSRKSLRALKIESDCLAEYGVEEGAVLFVDLEMSPYPGCKILLYHDGFKIPQIRIYNGQDDLGKCIYYGVVIGKYIDI